MSTGLGRAGREAPAHKDTNYSRPVYTGELRTIYSAPVVVRIPAESWLCASKLTPPETYGSGSAVVLERNSRRGSTASVPRLRETFDRQFPAGLEWAERSKPGLPYRRNRPFPHEQITFNDLVPLALEILEANAYPLGGVRQTFSHVFLDEFQDCTKQQYELIKAAFGQSTQILTAVGDTKQRIMTWAGALDGVLQTFAKDFSALPLPLYQNFRSAPRLRRMQNRMIAKMDPEAVSPPKTLLVTTAHRRARLRLGV